MSRPRTGPGRAAPRARRLGRRVPARIIGWLAMLVSVAMAPAYAQVAVPTAPTDTAAATRTHDTGNDWIDSRLRDMDAYAARYRDAFVDEIVRYHEAPRALVDEALADDGMSAGDVYFACALAQASGRSCRELVEARRANPAAGWEAIAAQSGTAPDAALYRRIRDEITASYARWARPLDAGGKATP